ncbi:MAG: RNA methyltransferase [Bacilli bacterium]
MIESINNEKIKYIKSLLIKKNILREKKFIVETEHLVQEAVNSGRALEIFYVQDYDNKFNIKSTMISDKVMKYISSLTSSTKVLCICSTTCEKEIVGNVVILDNVADPGNVGTIIRSCVAFNISTLILTDGCASIYNDKVIRSSEGNIFHLNIVKMNLSSAIDIIKKKGITLVGTSLKKSNDIEKLDNRYAVIFGNEASGIDDITLSKCDKVFKIRMNKNCESLNVAVSCGIVLYELDK